MGKLDKANVKPAGPGVSVGHFGPGSPSKYPNRIASKKKKAHHMICPSRPKAQNPPAATTLVLFFLLTIAFQTTAQIRLPRLISDGMVLQRDTKLKIWGWALF